MNAGTRILFGIAFCCIVISANAAMYTLPAPGNDVVGQNFVVTMKRGNSIDTLRWQYDVSYNELMEANPHINFHRPKVGQKVLIPHELILPKFRRGIVINVPELRLYYFPPDGQYFYTFPVGLGRIDWRTPMIDAKVVRKERDPTWHIPNDIREYVLDHTGELLPDSIPPGPENPLGDYALYLSKPGYLIHGTNIPSSVGTFISSGCMRLLSEPIQTLFHETPIGTPVHVIHYPNKAGWRGNVLYLESHPPVAGYPQDNSDLNKWSAEAVIYEATALRPGYVDWGRVNNIISKHLGVPEPIGKN